MTEPIPGPSPSSLIDRVPVIPVVVLHDVAHAVPVAEALVAGGVPVIELTLRTPVALDCIEQIASNVPEILVGAGTIVAPEQAEDAASAGASSWSPPVRRTRWPAPCRRPVCRIFPAPPPSARCCG